MTKITPIKTDHHHIDMTLGHHINDNNPTDLARVLITCIPQDHAHQPPIGPGTAHTAHPTITDHHTNHMTATDHDHHTRLLSATDHNLPDPTTKTITAAAPTIAKDHTHHQTTINLPTEDMTTTKDHTTDHVIDNNNTPDPDPSPGNPTITNNFNTIGHHVNATIPGDQQPPANKLITQTMTVIDTDHQTTVLIDHLLIGRLKVVEHHQTHVPTLAMAANLQENN